MLADEDPMVAELPTEVPLLNAPLVRVLAQLRFPFIAAVESASFIAPFQEAIRGDYPVLRKERAHTISFEQGDLKPSAAQTIWRFNDSSAHWRVSLTTEFLAIETIEYRTRADFLNRLRVVVDALVAHVKPSHVDRLGIRYVDRIRAPEIDRIGEMVRPEVRGIAATAGAKHLEHTLTESRFVLDKAELVARWGRLPANVTHEPTAIEPIAEPSWILDLDMFSTRPIDFAANALAREAEEFAKRIYIFFRWAVTNEFLRSYGGDV